MRQLTRLPVVRRLNKYLTTLRTGMALMQQAHADEATRLYDDPWSRLLLQGLTDQEWTHRLAAFRVNAPRSLEAEEHPLNKVRAAFLDEKTRLDDRHRHQLHRHRRDRRRDERDDHDVDAHDSHVYWDVSHIDRWRMLAYDIVVYFDDATLMTSRKVVVYLLLEPTTATTATSGRHRGLRTSRLVAFYIDVVRLYRFEGNKSTGATAVNATTAATTTATSTTTTGTPPIAATTGPPTETL